MKNVFIVGSRGYHANYGGWETFVSNLVDHYDDKNTRFYISMYTDDRKLGEYQVNNNIIVTPIYVGNMGSATMFFYSIKAFNYYLKYIESHSIDGAIIYVLGLKLFNYLGLKRSKIRKLGIKILVNPDGLEHERSKWSYPVKKFFLLSERLMLNRSDVIVCDGLGIQKYIVEKYPKLRDRTVYIAYGAKVPDLVGVDEKVILKEYHLKKDGYCLMVGRCVPENNYELIIREFMNSKIEKDLVIITNLSSSKYYSELVSKMGVQKDKRIHFIDGVYDQVKLGVIRKNAYLYIHGHSVGGTNPSLIEALSLTDLNILYDVCFNHDIGGKTCLYFQEKGSLTRLLDDKKLLDSSKKRLGLQAKELVNNNFTWEKICCQYKEILK